jgi:DNA-binding CsgD family transcriptional regulator
MKKRSGRSRPPPASPSVPSLDHEIEQLRHVVAVHCEALLLDRTIVYAVDFQRDAFSYISPYAEELTGFTANQWQCEGAYSAMMSRCHAEDLPSIELATVQACRQPTSLRHCVNLTYRWKDNFDRWRWCRDRFQVLIDDGGQPMHMFGSFREITELVESARLHQAWIEAGAADASAESHPSGDPDLLAAVIDTGGLGLTRIQRRVLELILAGLSNKQIALRLRRSIRTIEDHRYRIMRKVGAENAVDLVRKVLRLGPLKGEGEPR